MERRKTGPQPVPPPAIYWPRARPAVSQPRLASPPARPSAPVHRSPPPPPVYDPHRSPRPLPSSPGGVRQACPAPAPPAPRPAAHVQRATARSLPTPVARAPVLQRATKSKWATAPIKAEAKKNAKGALFAAGKALHHKLSKEHLQSIEEMNKTARKEKKKGAKRFWNAVLTGTKDSAPPGTSDVKRIWNIPANLELGPEIVSNNVGMDLDPNTEPIGPQNLTRRLTYRSSQFREILETYRNATVYANRDLTNEEWDQMAQNLENANQRHSELTDTLLSPPLLEQWEKTGKGDGYNRKFLPELQPPPTDENIYIYYEDDGIDSAFEFPASDLQQLEPEGLVFLTREQFLEAMQ